MTETDIPANRAAASEIGAVDFAALGQASAKLMHDFKNQLGGLKLYATFLKTRLAHDPESAEIVSKIVQGVDSMADNANLVNRFAHPLDLRCESGDVVDLVKKNVVAHSSQAALRQVALVTEGMDTPVRMRFDWQLLQSAFEIILKRALAVAPPHSTIIVRVEQREQTICLSFSDAGLPLTELAQQRFFDWMSQERMQKTALELAHAARIVRAHGGEVGVKQTESLTNVEFIFKSELPPQEQHA